MRQWSKSTTPEPVEKQLDSYEQFADHLIKEEGATRQGSSNPGLEHDIERMRAEKNYLLSEIKGLEEKVNAYETMSLWQRVIHVVKR